MTTTETEVQTLTTAAALGQALDQAMARDPSVLLLGEDVEDRTGGGVFHISEGLSTKYPGRVRTTPISEQAIVGAAIGAAIAGFRPVAELMFMDFFAVAMDQISNHAAKLRYMSGGQTGVPLTIRTAAGAGMQFGAQHSEMLEAWVHHVPGLKVVVASTPADAKGLLTAAIFDDDPVVFIEPTLNYWVSGPVPVGDHMVPIGKAQIRRPGKDVTVLTYGREVDFALRAADAVAADGINVEVIDLRSLVPLDEATVLESVGRTRRAVIAHQAVRRGGVGAELSCLLYDNFYGEMLTPVVRVCGPDTPIPYAAELEQAFLVTAERIAEGIRLASR